LSEPTSIIRRDTISRGFAHLESIVFRHRRSDGETADLQREILDAGDGVTILPYDPVRGTIILIRQFRGVAFLQEGREAIVEACAGKLEGEDPVTRIVKETEEETGIRLVGPPRLIFTAYSSPGIFTERLSYFVAPYSAADRVTCGGGLREEEEDIEVIETTLDAAIASVEAGEMVDSKTILLLYYAKATGLMNTKLC
jgi:nudix-type nucleoside diphosphatase (YffH/AdpP family)